LFFFPTYDGSGQCWTERLVHLAQSLALGSVDNFLVEPRFVNFQATRHGTPPPTCYFCCSLPMFGSHPRRSFTDGA